MIELEKERLKSMPYAAMKELQNPEALVSPNSPEKQKHDKMSNYAKYVKEMYWPSVSQNKQSEMEQLRRKVEEQNTRRSVDAPKPSRDDKPWRAAIA